MKMAFAFLLGLALLTLPVDTADARGGGMRGGGGGGSRGGARGGRSRKAKSAKSDRARDRLENRDGLRRDAGRDAL